MSPERAKAFVVEDDKHWQDIIRESLEDEGHQLILLATNLNEALAAIDRFAELGVQVAIIDGNLSEDDKTGSDGQKVLSVIRKVAPQVKTIGHSSHSVCGVDVDLGKENSVNLGETVTEL
ncbi:MAG: hypothetical protein ABII80_04105 [bacterium]